MSATYKRVEESAPVMHYSSSRGSVALNEDDARDMKRLVEVVERLRSEGVSLPQALDAVGIGEDDKSRISEVHMSSSLTEHVYVTEPEIFAVDSDAYGLVIMRLVHYFDQHEFSNFPLLSCAHAGLLWGVNFALQMGVTCTLLVLAEELENPWEDIFFKSHYGMGIYDAAETVRAAVSVTSGAGQEVDIALLGRCREAIGVPHSFYWLMMYLWMVKNFGELERSFFLLVRLSHVEIRKDKDLPLLSEDGSTIERLDRWMISTLMLLVPLTKVAIATLITYAGMKFLVLQNNELTIILKALSMQFVTTIDELLLSLATTRTKTALSNLKIKTTVMDPGRKNSLWDAGLGGMLHLAITIAATAFILQCTFGGLISFRQACNEFHTRYGLEGVLPVRSLLSWFGPDARRLVQEALSM